MGNYKIKGVVFGKGHVKNSLSKAPTTRIIVFLSK